MSVQEADLVILDTAGPSMAGLLAALHSAAFHRPGDETWSARAFADVIATPNAFCLIAHKLGGAAREPCGFAACRILGREAELLSIGVVPASQGLGIAAQLINETCARAYKAGARDLFLEVAEDNPRAQGVYASLGFEEVGRRTGYYRRLGERRVDALTMRLGLQRA